MLFGSSLSALTSTLQQQDRLFIRSTTPSLPASVRSLLVGLRTSHRPDTDVLLAVRCTHRTEARQQSACCARCCTNHISYHHGYHCKAEDQQSNQMASGTMTKSTREQVYSLLFGMLSEPLLCGHQPSGKDMTAHHSCTRAAGNKGNYKGS